MIVNESGGIPNRLFFRLFQTGNILQRQVQNEMGISAVQWAVLGALSREGFEDGTSFNQLKEYLYVSPKTSMACSNEWNETGMLFGYRIPRIAELDSWFLPNLAALSGIDFRTLLPNFTDRPCRG